MKYQEIVPLVNDILGQYTERLTIRQIYYRLVSPPYQAFANTKSNYKTLSKILVKARETGDVDEDRIEDRARTTIGGDHGFDSPTDLIDYAIRRLEQAYEYYTRKMWDEQDEYIEVWVEKDALVSIFSSIANGFRVITYPTRGYSSYTLVKEAIKRFDDYNGKPIIILHFADHDPSGLDMTRDIEDRLYKYYNGDFKVKRISLTIDQVKKYGLVPNPTKRADARSPKYIAQYGDECWELDAIPPNELRAIIKDSIEAHIDAQIWNETLDKIEQERKIIKDILEDERIAIDGLKKRLISRLNGVK
ncbi:hypothetical protein KEJ19_08455 [Candidatus Bathyarchaeota archaeon]|nr:hypothetical protein [Candidatus Bathyarchaeota archaeon]